MSGEQQPYKFGSHGFKRDAQPEVTASVLRDASASLTRTPLPTTPPPRDLSGSIQDSAAEIAIIWILHRSALTQKQRDEPLDQQIRNFSATAFDAIVARFPALRGARNEHLWLIYFKGLLASATPTRGQMLEAIKTIRLENEPATPRSSPVVQRPRLTAVPKTVPPPFGDAASDLDALEQISRALSEKNSTGSEL